VEATQLLAVQACGGVKVAPLQLAPTQSVVVLHCTQPAVALHWPADPVHAVGCAATQTLPVHVEGPVYVVPEHAAGDAQSLALPHPLPTGQVFPSPSHCGPPQSTPVSLPSLTMSPQDTQVPGLVPKQRLFAQSPFTMQCSRSGQSGHTAPPQSTSVSLPSLTPSEQLAGWHAWFAHTPSPGQSVSALHATHVPSPAHTVPPLSVQGVPVAALVETHALAVHVGATQRVGEAVQSVATAHSTHVPLAHTALWQSVDTAHVSPVAQGGQVPPPQSTAVSDPFCMPSVHVGAGGPLSTPVSTPVSTCPVASVPPFAS
jgi:hypothetical protein